MEQLTESYLYRCGGQYKGSLNLSLSSGGKSHSTLRDFWLDELQKPDIWIHLTEIASMEKTSELHQYLSHHPVFLRQTNITTLAHQPLTPPVLQVVLHAPVQRETCLFPPELCCLNQIPPVTLLWWLTKPLWKMMDKSSVGMMKFPIWWEK